MMMAADVGDTPAAKSQRLAVLFPNNLSMKGDVFGLSVDQQA